MALRRSAFLLGLLLALLGCAEAASAPAAPPRADDPITFPQEASVVAVDLGIDLAGLERELEADIPRQLWSIYRKGQLCVPSRKVDLAVFKVKTPKIKCDIQGTVRRGKVRLVGRGRELVLRMPITATLVARDIGGILKRETATAALDLRLGMTFDLARDWRLRGQVAVDYAWSRQPGIDFLGRRIVLTEEADEKLAPLKARIAARLERALAEVNVRAAAERGWRAAHTVIELNRENPAVWGRIMPQRFHYGGYRITGQRMVLSLGLEGQLETFVGTRPAAPEPGPLPPVEQLDMKGGEAILRVPVVADYAVLEPVLAQALAKRAGRPFVLGEYGTVKARFSDVVVYGTSANRIAVGVTFDASSDLALWKRAKGRLWLTGRPVNAPNSRAVAFAEVAIAGETDMIGEELLLALANSGEFKGIITEALAQNFERDFASLKAKIDRAVARRQDGPVDYSVRIDRISTGRLHAHGQGLYLPVELRARIDAKLVKMDPRR
ncbi:MAG: DUF4403 family protein [Porphyrobacter sp.]|nr:DUF4403 family protein [Porphyrobacter sp.]